MGINRQRYTVLVHVECTKSGLEGGHRGRATRLRHDPKAAIGAGIRLPTSVLTWVGTRPSTFEKRDLAVVWLRNEQRMIEDAVADELRWVSPRSDSRRGWKAEPKVVLGEYGAKWIVERRNSKENCYGR